MLAFYDSQYFLSKKNGQAHARRPKILPSQYISNIPRIIISLFLISFSLFVNAHRSEAE